MRPKAIRLPGQTYSMCTSCSTSTRPRVLEKRGSYEGGRSRSSARTEGGWALCPYTIGCRWSPGVTRVSHERRLGEGSYYGSTSTLHYCGHISSLHTPVLLRTPSITTIMSRQVLMDTNISRHPSSRGWEYFRGLRSHLRVFWVWPRGLCIQLANVMI
ncbi:hypothetical protein OH77DRAFT_1296867 [Trametes cingulata]|nr:hypothetical protein OH77DRAFT_1296867 [Trametes cingulata]